MGSKDRANRNMNGQAINSWNKYKTYANTEEITDKL